MRFKIPKLPLISSKTLNPLTPKPHMASLLTAPEAQARTLHSDPPQDLDDVLCSDQHQQQEEQQQNFADTALSRCLSGESRIERAWAHWSKLGRPKLIVAPMVDNSELPFRMLCRKYGADAAYTPMLHSRIFTESEKYRDQEFTTCKVTVFEFGDEDSNVSLVGGFDFL